jgi:hypothetical protein
MYRRAHMLHYFFFDEKRYTNWSKIHGFVTARATLFHFNLFNFHSGQRITFSLALPACLDTSLAMFVAPPLLSAIIQALSTTVSLLFGRKKKERKTEWRSPNTHPILHRLSDSGRGCGNRARVRARARQQSCW